MTVRSRRPFDVVVLGEPLIEIGTRTPLHDGAAARVGVSGDALNVSAAAAAAGADVGLVAVLSDDELGAAIAGRIGNLGISTDLLRFAPGRQGIYFSHSDPQGQREFTYVRSDSVGSRLDPDCVDTGTLAEAGVVVASGITVALSDSAKSAVFAAAAAAGRFVYDPNFRARLSTTDAARTALLDLAPYCELVTPSFPTETELIEADDPVSAARQLQGRGARNVAVTSGSAGIHLVSGQSAVWMPALRAPAVVDQTGAGDSFVGSTAARLALGDALPDAVLFGIGASSLAVSGWGGTGFVPSYAQTREHIAGAPGWPEKAELTS